MTPSTTRRIDAFPAPVARRRVLWVGSTAGLELGMARAAVGAQADVTDAESPQAASQLAGNADAAGSTPVFAILASDRPGRFAVADVLELSRVWPLMPIVSVATSLVDGRRRSGPQLPGIEEVPWHDLPGRCGWWLAAFESGLPSSLGLPAATRREERLLESQDEAARLNSKARVLVHGGVGVCVVKAARHRRAGLWGARGGGGEAWRERRRCAAADNPLPLACARLPADGAPGAAGQRVRGGAALTAADARPAAERAHRGCAACCAEGVP